MFSTKSFVIFTVFYCLTGSFANVPIVEKRHEIGETEMLKDLQQTMKSIFENQPIIPSNERINDDQIFGYPRCNTGKGNIRGQTNPYAHSFFAIPFAEPPIGERRYMPPVAKDFQEEIEASQPNRVQCIQSGSSSDMSEDCLVLNIHVPSSVNNESFTDQQFDQLLPVMVYIHGGSFATGSGTSKGYDGRFLSNSTNTVVITINYRLGALGALVYEENGVSFGGNQGIKDQQLALKWVKDEIENFGGNPDMITIFGLSAGAQSVMFHLASKISKPYFKRCIMESNPAIYDYPTVERAKVLSSYLVELLNCSNDYNSNIDCLRNIDAKTIIEQTKGIAAKALREADHRTMVEPFRPIVDGDEFPEQPLAMFQNGNWNKDVDVIIGTNREELSDINVMFYDRTIPLGVFKAGNTFLVGKDLEANVTEAYSSLVPDGAGPMFDYTDILAQEVGDVYFVCPTRLLARFISATSNSDNNYLYSWEHASCDDPQQSCYYSYHGAEASYVFGTRSYTGKINEEDEQAITAMMTDFWGSFAYTGIPTSESHDTWIKYVPMTASDNSEDWSDLHMMYPRATMETNYNKDLCDFWDSLNYYVEIQSKDTDGGNSSSTLKFSSHFLIGCLLIIINRLFYF